MNKSVLVYFYNLASSLAFCESNSFCEKVLSDISLLTAKKRNNQRKIKSMENVTEINLVIEAAIRGCQISQNSLENTCEFSKNI